MVHLGFSAARISLYPLISISKSISFKFCSLLILPVGFSPLFITPACRAIQCDAPFPISPNAIECKIPSSSQVTIQLNDSCKDLIPGEVVNTADLEALPIFERIQHRLSFGESVTLRIGLGASLGLFFGHILKRIGKIILSFLCLQGIALVVLHSIQWIQFNTKQISQDLVPKKKRNRTFLADLIEKFLFATSLGVGIYLSYINTHPLKP